MSRQAGSDTRAAAIPVWRKALYAALVVGLFFALLEGGLALLGVRPISQSEDPFVGFAARYPLFEQSEDDAAVVATAPNKLAFFNYQEFAARKAKGSYRIFCMGGSTTYGRPYGHKTSFCGWLGSLLPVADPSRTWAVINAGGVSYASYRVAALTEELAQYEPDLFVVYTGHNEFLEERTYRDVREVSPVARWLRGLAYETRSYAALRQLSNRAGTGLQPGESKELLAGEVRARLDNIVGPDDYVRDEALEERVAGHFRSTLDRMVDLARDSDARTLFVVPASNSKDCSPFKSQHRASLSEPEQARFDVALAEGLGALRTGEFDAAVAAFDAALAIDDRFAEAHYRRGRALLALGRSSEGTRALRRALREDVCPLRALPRLADSVASVARDRAALLVDFDAQMQREATRRAGSGAPGQELFLDHVHPTIEAHRLLAVEIIEALAQDGIVRLDAGWNARAIAQVAERVEARIDREEHAQALVLLSKVLHWAGKGEEARRVAEQASEVLPDDPQLRFKLALFAAEEDRDLDALRAYRELVAEYPGIGEIHLQIAISLSRLGQLPRALAHALYASYLRPDLDVARQVVGALLAALGHDRAAIPHLREALRRNPHNAAAKRDLEKSLQRVRGQAPPADVPAVLRAERGSEGQVSLLSEARRTASATWQRDGLEIAWRADEAPASLAFFEAGVLSKRTRFAPLPSLAAPQGSGSSEIIPALE